MNVMLRTPLLGAFAGLLCTAIGCGGNDAAPGAGPTTALKLSSDDDNGTFLTDGRGRTLYFFGEDLPGSGSRPAVSNCDAECASVFPVFHAGDGAVKDIDPNDVAEFTRADGAKQTTYRGWPLYFFVGDSAAGAVNGEGVDSIWFVLHDQPYTVTLLSQPGADAPEFRSYLADGTGRSLYFFSHDTVGTAEAAPVSACTTPECVSRFPIFRVDDAVIPSVLSADDFTVFTRSDGQVQSAFKGHPLYLFSGDAAPGQTNGRGVADAWDTLNPRAF